MCVNPEEIVGVPLRVKWWCRKHSAPCWTRGHTALQSGGAGWVMQVLSIAITVNKKQSCIQNLTDINKAHIVASKAVKYRIMKNDLFQNNISL